MLYRVPGDTTPGAGLLCLLGAVLGTQLYRPVTSPRYLLGHGFALGYLAANVAVVSTLWWVLKRENSRRDVILLSQYGDRKDEGSAPLTGDDDPRWRFHL